MKIVFSIVLTRVTINNNIRELKETKRACIITATGYCPELYMLVYILYQTRPFSWYKLYYLTNGFILLLRLHL